MQKLQSNCLFLKWHWDFEFYINRIDFAICKWDSYTFHIHLISCTIRNTCAQFLTSISRFSNFKHKRKKMSIEEEKKMCINFKLFRIKFIYWNVDGIVYIFNDMVWLIEFHIADFGGFINVDIVWQHLVVWVSGNDAEKRNSNTQNVDYLHSLSE